MIVLLLIVLGLVLGSFVNALVWRVHEHKDWVNDRSECAHCHHKLGPLDLVPVLSWVFLRGKCRYCHKKIDDNPLVETALPILFVLSYNFWPVALHGSALFEFVAWLILLVGLLALAVYDLRWFLLPDKMIFPLVGLTVLQVVVVSFWDKNWHELLAAAGGTLVISGLFYLIFQLSKGTWIGGGDVKLGFVIGPLAGGVLEGFLLIFTASVIGMLFALPLLLKGQAGRKTQLPFGPLLIAGLVVVKLFGASVIGWYAGLFYV
jgi:prepilin signal peptidase PulO-like enzyme (type II secretory pathway)